MTVIDHFMVVCMCIYTFTLHKPACKRFQHNSYLVFNIDDQWQSDLNDMQSLHKYNDGYLYILK